MEGCLEVAQQRDKKIQARCQQYVCEIKCELVQEEGKQGTASLQG